MVDVFDGLRLEKKELESRLKVVNRLLTSKDVKLYLDYESNLKRDAEYCGDRRNIEPLDDSDMPDVIDGVPIDDFSDGDINDNG